MKPATRAVCATDSSDNRNLTKDVRILKVDYEVYARERGEEAADAAQELGLSPEEVARFRRVFGTPIAPELR